MKKIIAIVLALICLTAVLAGCDIDTSVTPTPQSNYEQQMAANEENARDISNQYGVPNINRSLDYENVKRRLEYLNQGNNVGYLYLLTENGQLVRESQVLGKVTSLNTFITPMEEVVQVEKGDRGNSNYAYPGSYVVVQAADVDGTYGENVQGIFWFTPDGVYQEWPGLYLFSSERLTYSDVELLVSANK